MTDDPTGSCPTCARRDPEEGSLLCPPCRSRLRSWLSEIPDLHEQLLTEEPVGIAAQSAGGRVSGSKERRLPIRVDPLDLTAPARQVWLLGEDQVGYESVASLLDFWVRDWREARGGREGLPAPTVPVLASWLSRRVDDAMDSHGGIEEFWQAIRRAHGALRGQLGLIDVPDYKRGVPCRRCSSLTLVRNSGSDWIECGSCEAILSPEEYTEWVADMAAQTRKRMASAA